jgi:hypothetical protein
MTPDDSDDDRERWARGAVTTKHDWKTASERFQETLNRSGRMDSWISRSEQIMKQMQMLDVSQRISDTMRGPVGSLTAADLVMRSAIQPLRTRMEEIQASLNAHSTAHIAEQFARLRYEDTFGAKFALAMDPLTSLRASEAFFRDVTARSIADRLVHRPEWELLHRLNSHAAAAASVSALQTHFHDPIERALRDARISWRELRGVSARLVPDVDDDDLLMQAESVVVHADGSVSIADARLEGEEIEQALNGLFQAPSTRVDQFLASLRQPVRAIVLFLVLAILNEIISMMVQNAYEAWKVPDQQLIEAHQSLSNARGKRVTDEPLTRAEARQLMKEHCAQRGAYLALRVVTGDRVRLRKAANLSSSIIAHLPRGAMVGVVAKHHRWAFVEVYADDDRGFLEGWIDNKYLERPR